MKQIQWTLDSLGRSRSEMNSALRQWAKKPVTARCYVTGSTDIDRLESHHAFNYSDFPLFRFVTFNKVFIHEKHHKAIHRIYGRSNNNPMQLIMYKYFKYKYALFNILISCLNGLLIAFFLILLIK